MQPVKLIPSHLLPPSSRRRAYGSRSKSSRAIVANLAPLFAGLATIVLSIFYYIAIRRHNVQLSFKQLSEFERHVQTGGNRSVYFVELPQHEELLMSFSPEEWQKISTRIDHIVFLYDDIDVIASPAVWVPNVTAAFARMEPPTYGILLFSCGCIVPNTVFINTQTRFDGSECTMLPGFIIPEDAVAFINISTIDDQCRRRDEVLSARWYSTNAWKIPAARKEHTTLRAKLAAQGT